MTIEGKDISDYSGEGHLILFRIIDPDTGCLSTYEETPNVINTFFTEIGPHLEKDINPV